MHKIWLKRKPEPKFYAMANRTLDLRVESPIKLAHLDLRIGYALKNPGKHKIKYECHLTLFSS